MAKRIVGCSVELTFRPKKPDGSAPDVGQITRYAVRRWWNGIEQDPALVSFTAPNTYTAIIRFPMDGQWAVRFETDGLETSDERYYTIQPSVFVSPS